MSELRSRISRAARARADELRARVKAFESSGGVEGWARRLEAKVMDEQRRLASGHHPLHPDHQARIRLWYARLELPLGADAGAVRRQFRALMRQYHPDRFAARGEGERLATRVSQELTVAYEGLLDYLGEH